MSILKQIALSLFLLAATAGAWVGYGALAPEAEGAGGRGDRGGRGGGAAPVTLATVETAVETARIRAVGTAEAAQAAALHPKASGTVTELLYAPGDRVRAGDVLARLDDEAERLAVALAKTELAEAERALARVEKLAPSGVAAQSQLDAARVAAAGARNRLAAAELALARRSVVAPWDGVLGLAPISVGDAASPGEPVAYLDDRSSLRVAFDVAEKYAARLRVGLPVAATAPAFPGEDFTGRIVALDSRLDPATRTLRAEAEIPNPEDRLRPGMSFVVALDLGGAERTAVPEAAVLRDRDGAYVWTVADGAARRVDVTVIERADGLALVAGDLRPGDQVAVEGLQRLRPGAKVSVVGESEAPDDAARAEAPSTL